MSTTGPTESGLSAAAGPLTGLTTIAATSAACQHRALRPHIQLSFRAHSWRSGAGTEHWLLRQRQANCQRQQRLLRRSVLSQVALRKSFSGTSASSAAITPDITLGSQLCRQREPLHRQLRNHRQQRSRLLDQSAQSQVSGSARPVSRFHRNQADPECLGHGGQRWPSWPPTSRSARTGLLYGRRNAISSSATVQQMLTAFPQYCGVSDAWGNVGNFNYESLQIVLNQRMHNGLSFNVNYTYAKNLGDDGTYRSGFDLPADTILRGKRTSSRTGSTARGRRSPCRTSSTHSASISCHSARVRSVATIRQCAGWPAAGSSPSIYTYESGTPMAVTWSGASGTTPGQGQGMPDLDTTFSGSARTGGSYGSGPGGYTRPTSGKFNTSIRPRSPLPSAFPRRPIAPRAEECSPAIATLPT